ncbi:MAG: aminoacyl-tRNA hydrolase [Christensenellaceae bacterium]|jgi:PTH1 family peptidyl-tRNA hydrolase|nr:aminoacyl-tRNA hydrolase [Christensenellaceae bacterium]
MKLIVGLGNPGNEYAATYHNVGFIALDEFMLGSRKEKNYVYLKTADALFIKPQTFMNLSGQAVIAAMNKYKVAAEDVIIVCDDVYIKKGCIRISVGGSSGGHNGLKNIAELLGAGKADKITKIRIGIAKTDADNLKLNETLADYVLSRIDAENTALLEPAITAARLAIKKLVAGETISNVQSEFNKR